ncbi:glutamine-hydrolyzing GMP synthase [Mitsuokella jalaludinii]|uniref:glutamine-hydrolyzing GMP synthase n=1 Tax=Mitsuokella jalaludinii TaxID=187979 RepID=UPI003AF958AE
MILVLDFGGQYNQLIARRVRENHVYCEVHPQSLSLEKIREMAPKGIILTGGPNSVYTEDAVTCSPEIFELGIPVLGICYGSQLMAHLLGGKVETAPTSEYGKTEVTLNEAGKASKLFAGVREKSICWMSHTDYIAKAPEGFTVTAFTPVCPVAAMENAERRLYATQFHPEVMHTEQGKEMLHNFVYNVCACKGDWKMDSFVKTTIEELKAKIGTGKALCALSGGVDSSVAAVLLSKAIGKQLTCVFVDHGLLRKDEGDQVESVFGPEGPYDLNFIRVNAKDRFYEKLKGVTEPEKKRKIIGEEFIHVFEEEAAKLQGIHFLGQGTIYPDIVESDKGVKAHHNVGGLPEKLGFELVEPVKYLFKDEVRQVGEALGLPHSMVWRQPFPGPGLGVRCIGAITRDRLAAVRESDAILREEFAKSGMDAKVWQYFTIVPDIRTTGVVDGKRTELWPVIIRAVNTTDAMTASVPRLDWELLETVTRRVQAEVPGVSRVLYDLSPKPPATIEWE